MNAMNNFHSTFRRVLKNARQNYPIALAVLTVSSQWLDARRGRVLGASDSVAFQVGSLAASPLLGGTRTGLRVCTDAGRVGGRIVGLETEIADGHALRQHLRVDFDRCPQSGGDGGLTADAERVILRNGSTVVIRLLAAGDEAAIARWFAGLSAEKCYARFFGFLELLDRRTESVCACGPLQP